MDLNKLDGSKYLIKPSAPFKMTERCKINTGYVCNAKCHFCYFDKSKVSNFHWDTIIHQLHVAHNYGIRDVDFSGGEPTLNQSLIPMIDYARTIGFRRICVITNGTTFHDKYLLKLCKLHGLNEILFSLHGPRKVQNAIMGVKGAYDKIIKSIENAIELGIRVRVNSVVSSQTYRYLPQLADTLMNYDIANHNIIMFKHCYDQTHAEIDQAPSHDEAAKYIITAINICRRSIPYINVRYIPFCFMNRYEKHVVNYNQKKYDPLEWSNTLLVKFYMSENDIKSMCLGFLNEDKVAANNLAIKNYSSNAYIKSNKCIHCKHFLMCDGFEKEYAKKFDINSEVKPNQGKKISDPMHYRYGYYEGIVE